MEIDDLRAEVAYLKEQNQLLQEQVKYLSKKNCTASQVNKFKKMVKHLYLVTMIMVFSKTQSQLENKSKPSLYVKRKGKVRKRKSPKNSRSKKK